MRIRTVLASLVAVTAVLGVALAGPANADTDTDTDTDKQTVTFEIRDRGDDLNLGEIKQLVEKRVKTDIGRPARGIVVSDLAGTPLPADALHALYSGKDSGDRKLLATVEKPVLGDTLGQLKKAAGGATTAVIHSQWDADGAAAGDVSAKLANRSGIEIITVCQVGFDCVRIVSWTPGSFLP